MGVLVNYASSDDEDDTKEQPRQSSNSIHAADFTKPARPSINGSIPGKHTNGSTSEAPVSEQTPLIGPAIGPRSTDAEMVIDLEEENRLLPQSPYSANRALLRDLTLPSIPNYEIPPSPPGSPNASTTTKFKKFLDLKKQSVHFNDKLAKSSALKNPSLMEKLMDFSDIDEAGQYATTLSKELWNPSAFPEYAYKEDLAKSQQKISKRKEDEKLKAPRESVDFVPATVTSRSGSQGNGGKGGQKSAAERIMAGLDRGRSNSPQVAGTKRKTRFDS